MRISIAVLSLFLMGMVVYFAPAEKQALTGPKTVWIKIVFGLDGEAARWDGRLEGEQVRIFQLEEWGLEARDRLIGETRSWQMQTAIPQGRRASFAEPLRGLLAKVEYSVESLLSVETEQGNFQFKPVDLTAGRATKFLEGRASVELLGSEEIVAQTNTDDDYASIAVDERGERHVAWISYDDDSQSDQIWIRNVDRAASQSELAIGGNELTDARLFVSGGKLLLLWCSPGANSDWDIYAATRDGQGWQTERLTTAAGTDFQLAADQADDGTLWIVWQSFRHGNGDIYAKCRRMNGQWSNDIAVTTGSANEWQPAVSIDGQGTAWIGYDTYEHGNYDVYLTSVSWDGSDSHIGDPIAVARSADFEAHASVLAVGKGQVWIAYDAAGENWGKDFRNVPTIQEGRYAEPLHASRRLELRSVENGHVSRPEVPLPQQRPPDRIHAIERTSTAKPARFYEFPQLARDGDGRIWLLFRLCRQGYSPHPPKGAVWEIYATTYTNKGWLDPLLLPRSRGRQNQRVAFAAGTEGALQCAWADGNRFASVGRKYAVHFGSLPEIAERAADVPWEEVSVDPPGVPSATPQAPWTISRNRKEYHLYFGDLHRHTNISRCSPTIDGSLIDAHRYALDAVEYDFLAITDHTRDVDSFSWWRTQKAADWFHLPGGYVPIYGYERSNGAAGGGHRNVFFMSRGADVDPGDAFYSGHGLPAENRNPDTSLYPWMREQGGSLTAAHTPLYSEKAMRGTWTYHDPQVEPVAEIFQGFRRSYERPAKQVVERASLWHALGKGYRLGFIASSDHISTHSSYACVWATEKSRAALFEGLQSRRTYAATDRIALEVRIGAALMGEETEVAGATVTLSIRAAGTAAIKEIEIIRSGEVLATLKPGTPTVELEHVDSRPLAGTSYYYVRLLQQDGAIAWGSPIWVRR